ALTRASGWGATGPEVPDSSLDGRRRVLDQRQDPARHEPRAADGGAAAGDLDDLDDAAAGVDLDAAAVAGGHDVVGADLTARIDDDLHPVAAHGSTVRRWAPTVGRPSLDDHRDR